MTSELWIYILSKESSTSGFGPIFIGFKVLFRHAVLVLLVLIGLELKLLDMAFSLLEGLEGLASLGLDGSEFNFELTNASLKLSHGIATTLGSDFIGLTQVQLKFSHCGVESSLALV